MKISMHLLLYKLRSESDPDVDISISFSNDIWTEDGELEEQLLANDSSLSDRTALFVLNSHISRWLPIIYIFININKNQMKFIYLFWFKRMYLSIQIFANLTILLSGMPLEKDDFIWGIIECVIQTFTLRK